MKDGKGKETNYTYHQPSGQVATITQPADKNGVRPQTRYTYEQKYATFKDATGTLKRGLTPVWLLTKESKCMVGAGSSTGCVNGGDDEVVTTYGYGPTSGANNLLLRSVKVSIKSATQSRLTCYSYDDLGNRISETKPRAGLFSCP
jgi:YD repeat-containing protein